MCLVSLNAIPNILAEDMDVYKVLVKTKSGRYYSPFRVMLYKPGDIVPHTDEYIIKNINEFGANVIETGYLHSYYNKSAAHACVVGAEGVLGNRIFNDTIVAVCAFKMIIPAGTQFFKGNQFDIASKCLYWEDTEPVFQITGNRTPNVNERTTSWDGVGVK